MANTFTRSKKVDADINKITKWSLNKFGEKQTYKYMQEMNASFQKIADNPELGRPYLKYLCFRYESHVIYYRQRRNDIFITRILHKKMLPEKHIKK